MVRFSFLSNVCFPTNDPTERELQVFEMLDRGLTVDAIAERLSRARKTVEAHRRQAEEKLGCDSAAELVVFAVRWTDMWWTDMWWTGMQWTDNHRRAPAAEEAKVIPLGKR